MTEAVNVPVYIKSRRGIMNHSNNNKSNPATDLSLILPLSQVPRTPSRPVRVIGIDLGTTNSTVTELIYVPGEDPPKALCIEVEQPTLQGIYTHHLVPSVVAIYQGAVYIGAGAKRLRDQTGDPNSELRRNRTIFWDCKNDMGLKRTYAHAPEGYRSAPDIASHVLRYLRDAAARPDGPPVERVVVTVPASFNAAQRQDTLKAAQAAGFEVEEGDFLDEPVAAFLNYLANPEVRGILTPGKEQNLLVFDFGGGTCDVAVLRSRRVAGGYGVRQRRQCATGGGSRGGLDRAHAGETEKQRKDAHSGRFHGGGKHGGSDGVSRGGGAPSDPGGERRGIDRGV